MARYDWNKLKVKYIAGDYENLKSFAEKHKINYDVLRRHACKWQEEKSQATQRKVTKITEKTIDKIIEREADRNARHIAIIDTILEKVEKIVTEELNKSQTPYGKTIKTDLILVDKLDTVMKIVEKAQRSHRLALNMDEKSQTATDQVNSNIQRLADLLNKPVPNRNIIDFDEEEE